jgi:hypothetical protein
VSVLGTASVWVVGAILVVLLSAFFFSVTAAQMTSEGTGERIHRRSVAVLTDIDASLPRIEADLRLAAAEAAEGDTVRVPGFPIPVDLSRDEALTLAGPALRDRLLDESAALIYADGMSVWAGGDPEALQDIERASTVGAVDTGLGLVREEVHTVFLIISVLLGLLLAMMIVILVVFLPREARLIVLGGVTLLAALPALAAAVGLRFAFRTAEADGDLFVDALLDIGSDAMWVPIRNFFTLALLGTGLLVAGMLSLWWESRSTDHGRVGEPGI